MDLPRACTKPRVPSPVRHKPGSAHVQPQNLRMEVRLLETVDQPQLHSKFETSLDWRNCPPHIYIKHYTKGDTVCADGKGTKEKLEKRMREGPKEAVGSKGCLLSICKDFTSFQICQIFK